MHDISNAIGTGTSEILSLTLISKIYGINESQIQKFVLRTMRNGVQSSNINRISHIVFQILLDDITHYTFESISKILDRETKRVIDINSLETPIEGCPFTYSKNRDEWIKGIIDLLNEKLSVEIAEDVNIDIVPEPIKLLKKYFPKK